jgi:hypothetical protein
MSRGPLLVAAVAAAAAAGAARAPLGAPPPAPPPHNASLAAALAAVCRAGHSARTARPQLPASRPSLAWRLALADGDFDVRHYSVVAAPRAGVAVVSPPAGGTFGVDLGSGREVWRMPLEPGTAFVPAVDVPGAGVVVGSLDTLEWWKSSDVSAVDPSSGETVWRAPGAGRSWPRDATRWDVAGVACDGRTVIASTLIDLFFSPGSASRLLVAALDGADGTPVWAREVTHPSGKRGVSTSVTAGVACDAAPPGGRGLVLVRIDAVVMALDGDDGKTTWTQVAGSFAVLGSGAGMVVAFGGAFSSLSVLAAATGDTVRAVPTLGMAVPTPAETAAPSFGPVLTDAAALMCGGDESLLAALWSSTATAGVSLVGNAGPRVVCNRTQWRERPPLVVLWGAWRSEGPVALVTSHGRREVVAVAAAGGEAWEVVSDVDGARGGSGKAKKLVAAGDGVLLVVGRAAIEAWAVPAGGGGPAGDGGGRGLGSSTAMLAAAIILAAVAAAAGGDAAWRAARPMWRAYRPQVDDGRDGGADGSNGSEGGAGAAGADDGGAARAVEAGGGEGSKRRGGS